MKAYEITGKNIHKSFDSVQAVKNISFEIKKNNTMGLLGPNGCEKTTTIGMMLGLITPSSGKFYQWNYSRT